MVNPLARVVMRNRSSKAEVNRTSNNTSSTSKSSVKKVSNLTEKDEDLIWNLINGEKPKKENILEQGRVTGTTMMSLSDAVDQIIGNR